MGWTQGQNERRELTENIRDKEARWLQKTRKTTDKMGGVCEKRPTTGTNGNETQEYPYIGVNNRPASSLHNRDQGCVPPLFSLVGTP